MKLLLASNGVSNDTIRGALAELLGEATERAGAVFVPAAIYAMHGGGAKTRRATTPPRGGSPRRKGNQ